MEIYVNTLFLSSKFNEINAQPSVYPKSIKSDLIKNGPDNYLFDFYAYFKVSTKVKFSVCQPPSLACESNWVIVSRTKMQTKVILLVLL